MIQLLIHVLLQQELKLGMDEKLNVITNTCPKSKPFS